jgi:hypothetical protein
MSLSLFQSRIYLICNERGEVVEKHPNGKAETESLNTIELKFRDIQLLKSQTIQEKRMQSGKMALAYGKEKRIS